MEKRDDFDDISQENASQKEELLENEDNAEEAVLTDEELDDVTGAHLGWRPQPVRKKNWKRTYWKSPF